MGMQVVLCHLLLSRKRYLFRWKTECVANLCRRLSAKNIKLLRPSLFGYLATREEFETYTKELLEFIEQGKLDIKIHEVYPLKDAARAQDDLEGRKTTGKLLLKP